MHNISQAPRSKLVAPLVMIASGTSLYAGAALAVGLFDQLPPAVVAWLRIAAAGVILVAVLRPTLADFWGSTGRLAAMFGVVTLGMNMVFYEAIARLPMGTAVAIEFLGPIVVAALGSKSVRDWLALGLATVGVLVLSGAQWSTSASGVLFALGAAVLWGLYILVGDKVSRGAAATGKRTGLAIGFSWAGLLAAPFVWGIYASQPTDNVPAVSMSAMTIVGLALGLGTLSAVIPYSLDQVVLSMAGPAYFALLLALLPLTAALLGAVVLGQSLSVLEIAGIVAVVAAVAIREPTT